MQRRKGESMESFRLRENASKRRRYVPNGRPSGRARTQPDQCITDECDRPPLAKSLCYRHYRAAQRAAGTPWACEGSKSFKARAARHGVAYEPINRRRVFERDDWICGICALPVVELDASLDHVIPMAKGGPHLYGNVLRFVQIRLPAFMIVSGARCASSNDDTALESPRVHHTLACAHALHVRWAPTYQVIRRLAGATKAPILFSRWGPSSCG